MNNRTLTYSAFYSVARKNFLTRNTQATLFALLILLLASLTACQGTTETIEVTVPVTYEVTRLVNVPVTVAAATGPAATPTAEAEPTTMPLPGTPDYPIRLIFPPTVPAPVVEARQQPFLDALISATGFTFETVIPANFREMLTLLCNEPNRTLAFLPPEVYVLAHEQCGAQVGQAFMRLGTTWNAGMIVVRLENPIASLEELNGQSWGVPGLQSRTGSLFFTAMFQQMGITPGPITEYPGDSRAMEAVFNGEVAFATATFVPPILPYNERPWQMGVDEPEPWKTTFATPARSDIGYVIANGDVNQGGYRVREARSALLDTVPGIFAQTRILALSPQIPFDAVVYGATFPFNVANEVAVAMTAFASQDVCIESVCSSDFLNMNGLEPVADSFYDSYREMIATAGWGEAEILDE
ncbi:MAG: PhnD/SsuA/transferrin family substrate-binding protein [Chloroflexi bacterium]|nr:PhnD/SsuA/transferrin family substrate-binding protein [Chloroflexota bacterium]MBP8054213.1 PhnD/SsuA/transferrin family substrate-binding protein [Chloroflexota bacterium]